MSKSFQGERLEEIRKDKGLTQKQLGELIGVKKNAISNYERNHQEPPVRRLKEIAKVLDISSDYLIGLTDDEIPASRKYYVPLPRNYSPEFKEEVMRQIDLVEHKFGYNKNQDK